MVTEMPCENMRFEAGLEGGDEAGGTRGGGDSGGGGGGGGGSGGGRNGETVPPSQEATVRNADAVMVRVGENGNVSTESVLEVVPLNFRERG